MSNLAIYIFPAITVLLFMFVPSLLLFAICIPLLGLILIMEFIMRKRTISKINPYLLSGIGALFGIIAVFNNSLAIPASIIAAFFILNSIIKVLFQEKIKPQIMRTDLKKGEIAESTHQDEIQTVVERNVKEDTLLEVGRMMDQSLRDIYSELGKMHSKIPSSVVMEDHLVEKITDSIAKEILSLLSKDHENYRHSKEHLTNIVNGEFEIVKNSLMELIEKMAITQKTQEELKNSLEEIENSSQNMPTIDIIREAVREEIRQMEGPLEIKHIQNYEIKNYFYQALDEATEEVCIISPWVSKWVITDQDIRLRFENLLKRGVNLKILYGIEGSSSSSKLDTKNDLTEKVVNDLRNKLEGKKYKGKLQIGKINSHYKLFICDDKFFVESSMNILSNKGDYGEGFVWHEGGQYSTDKKMLSSLKNIYFRSNSNYSAM